MHKMNTFLAGPPRSSGQILCVLLLLALFCPGAATAQPMADFDHYRTQFPLTGAHERISCESCHLAGTFSGTPTRCAVCHDGSGVRSDSGKSVMHIRSTNECNDCHLLAAWIPSRVDHDAVLGSCSSCHNGILAIGRSAGHPQSSNRCEECHRPTTWLGARFDHWGTTDSCYTCHNGVAATGKDSGHIQSGNSCEQCHTPGSWQNVRFDHSGVTGTCASCHNGVTATGKDSDHFTTSGDCDECHSLGSWHNVRFDHSGVTGTCASCHDGIKATGKHSGHLTTTADCDDCHSPGSWLNVQFDHSGVNARCASCHDGVGATGKDSGHFVTSRDCDECHLQTHWTPDTFSHTSSGYPGDHAGNLQCVECHRGNSEPVTWSSPSYQPDCAGCHASDFKRDAHKKVDSPRILYSTSELRDCSGACHMYRDSSFTTIEKTRSSKHRVRDGDW